MHRMTNWEIYRLGDIATMKYGKLPPKNNSGQYPIWSGYRNVGFTDTYNCSKGTIIVVARGVGGTGDVKIAKEDCFLTNLSIAVNIDTDICLPQYFYYKFYLSNLRYLDSGSAQSQITIDDLKRLQISLPSLEEQRRIAGILGAIDDKIENNRRINTNLELQAQALYKQWFVDFEFPNEEGKPYKSSGGKMVDSDLGPIPDGWSVGVLSDLANITMGQSPNGRSFNENGEGVVFYQGRTEFGSRYPSIRLYTTEPTRFAEPMSVLLSVRAPVGDINIATQRCCIGRGVASIKSKTASDTFMFCCLKELRPQLDQYNGEGTVFGSINRKELEGLTMCIPNSVIISKFNCLVDGVDKQMLNLFKQNNNLATLRDALLPKLMNGEIKV